MSEDMQQQLARMDGRIEGLTMKVDGLTMKVDGLSADFVDMKSIMRRTIATLVRLEGKVDDLAERMATKDDVAAVQKNVLGLAAKVDDMRYDWAKHEVRISALEKRAT